jgi:hypothetical protein
VSRKGDDPRDRQRPVERVGFAVQLREEQPRLPAHHGDVLREVDGPRHRLLVPTGGGVDLSEVEERLRERRASPVVELSFGATAELVADSGGTHLERRPTVRSVGSPEVEIGDDEQLLSQVNPHDSAGVWHPVKRFLDICNLDREAILAGRGSTML